MPAATDLEVGVEPTTASGFRRAIADLAGLDEGASAVLDFSLDLRPTLVVAPNPVCVGEPFTVSGQHWSPSLKSLTISDGNRHLLVAGPPTRFQPEADGRFSLSLVASASAPVGTYTEVTVFVVGEDAFAVYPVAIDVRACALPPLTATTPVVSGSPVVGGQLTATVVGWNRGTTFSYRWTADGTPIAGATQSRLRLGSGHAGKRIAVAVTGRHPSYREATRSSRSTLRVATATVPRISGSLARGRVVSVVPGRWTTGARLRYQWYGNGRALAVADRPSLRIASSLVGRRLSVRVTGSRTDYPTTSRTSTTTPRVAVVGTPSVVGSPQVGSRLTARPGTWTRGSRFSYQWVADGRPIAGARSDRLRLTPSLQSKRIGVRVAGRKAGYATLTAASRTTPRVARTAKPAIAGSATVSQRLTARPGAWTPGTRLAYRWFLAGKAVPRATASGLRLTPSMLGKRVTVEVTGRQAGYVTFARRSAATSPVRYPSVAEPVSTWSCPSWAPIKGNASSMIFHVPSARFYDATKPEECFRTESAARAAGYRKAKV